MAKGVKSKPSRGKKGDDFERQKKIVSSHIQQLKKNATKIAELSKKVNTGQASEASNLIKKLTQKLELHKQLVEACKNSFTSVFQLPDPAEQQQKELRKSQMDKFIADYDKCVTNVKAVTDRVIERENQSIANQERRNSREQESRAQSGDSGGEDAIGMQSMQHLDHADEIAQIKERRKEMNKFVNTTEELADICHDTNLIVHDQNEQIDEIEHKLETTEHKMDRGRRDLDAARKLQKKSRRKKLCIGALVIVFLVIVIGVAVGIAVMKKE